MQRMLMRQMMVIDDEPTMCSLIHNCLKHYYICTEAYSAEQALKVLAQGKTFELIISDVQLGGLSGIDLLRYFEQRYPETATIIMSGAQKMDTAVTAFRHGAADYLSKPFDANELHASIKRALKKLRQQNTCAISDELAWRASARVLMSALAARDKETHEHADRVVRFSLRLAEQLQLDQRFVKDLEFGAMLHDIGKIGVPDAVLRKSGKLTVAEWVEMRQHPLIGARMLDGIHFFKGAARIVAEHHEKWDGSGYPHGLKGSEIDLCARIFSIADAFDAIVSNRVYRKGESYETALREVVGGTGTQFDPRVVDAFTSVPASEWDSLRGFGAQHRSAARYDAISVEGDELAIPELRPFKQSHRATGPLPRPASAQSF